MAGQLSQAGVPVFVADIKGDVTGLAAPGDATNPEGRRALPSLGLDLQAAGHPVEFLSLSGKLGAQVRASVHSFGPLLLGKVLDLNETQTEHPRAGLQVLRRQRPAAARPQGPGDDAQVPRRPTRASRSSPTTAGCRRRRSGVLLRSIVVLEQEGADIFFGEPEFDVEDLIRTTPDGEGIVCILELSDVMDQPRLFSTFMLWMLAQLYETPARGRRPAQAEAVLLLRRGAPALRRRVGGADGPGRADRPAHPLQGRRRLLRHAGPDRRPVVGPGPARQPRPARAAGVHARRRRRAPQDRPDVPDDRLLRRRADDHLARDRRGAGHGPLAARRADAAGGDPAPGRRTR